MWKSLLLLCVISISLLAQSSTPPVLNNQHIYDLVAVGVSTSEVLRIIARAPKIDFDLRPVSTDALMAAGVSEDVIKAMAARESGSPAPVVSAVPVMSPLPATSAVLTPPLPSAAKVVIDVPVAPQPPSATIASDIASPSESHRLVYDGGSIPNLKTGTEVQLFLSQNEIHFSRRGADVFSLPASAVTEISYGQDVHRRIGAAIGLAAVSFGVGALMALTKSKKHFIGIMWDDEGNRGGAAFQADKRDYRGVLVGLEGITGRTAVNSATMTVKN